MTTGGADVVTKVKEENVVASRTEKAIVAWQGRKITVTFDDVKRRICPRATDQEVIIFLKMCQTLNLNPWARDVYMVKYKDDEPASIIVAAEAYFKAAETCENFDGLEAGVVLKDSTGKLEFREGSLILEEEEARLVGGWAKVYRKDRARPFYVAVNIKECQKYTKEGKPTRFWREMPATMVRKVALSRALREAFPTRLGGMISEAEYEEIAEGLPPALEKGGKPDWKKFWAKVKAELGLTTEEARQLLGVESIKEELIDAGWSMEKIWDELTMALQRAQTPATDDLRLVREKLDEAITQGEVRPDEAVDEIRHETGAAQAEPQKLKRNPETIRSINDLLRACHEDFRMQPREVYAELNVSSANEITELPSECYRKIAAVRQERTDEPKGIRQGV